MVLSEREARRELDGRTTCEACGADDVYSSGGLNRCATCSHYQSDEYSTATADEEAIPERSLAFTLDGDDEDSTQQLVPWTPQDRLMWQLLCRVRPLLRCLHQA